MAPQEIHFQYYVAGPGDRVDGKRLSVGLGTPEFDDSAWGGAGGPRAAARGAVDSPSRWMLVPRTIPTMEEEPLRLARVRRTTGVTVPPPFPAARRVVHGARSDAGDVLLDQAI